MYTYECKNATNPTTSWYQSLGLRDLGIVSSVSELKLRINKNLLKETIFFKGFYKERDVMRAIWRALVNDSQNTHT